MSELYLTTIIFPHSSTLYNICNLNTLLLTQNDTDWMNESISRQADWYPTAVNSFQCKVKQQKSLEKKKNKKKLLEHSFFTKGHLQREGLQKINHFVTNSTLGARKIC